MMWKGQPRHTSEAARTRILDLDRRQMGLIQAILDTIDVGCKHLAATSLAVSST